MAAAASGLGDLVDATLVELDARDLPWRDTAVDLAAGEEVTVISRGRVTLSEALGVWIGPQFQIWMRIGEDGEAFNGVADSHTFVADRRGRFYVAGYFPGQWGDRSGRVSTPLADYARGHGGFTVLVLRWRGRAAADGLARLAAAPGASVALRAVAERELERLSVGTKNPPRAWNYLWFLGRSEIFAPSHGHGRAAISCHTSANVGILQRPAPMPLREGTRLRWSWNIDALPSALPEDTPFTHDYLSIAVEFENGRDITYTWSCELEEGRGYWCPLPTWKDREFHVVVRSGPRDLGRWVEEERDLVADYRRFIGPEPRRVVRVWLIAVSLFQRGEGRALYRDIELDNGLEVLRLCEP